MKDLLARLDELHANENPEWSYDDCNVHCYMLPPDWYEHLQRGEDVDRGYGFGAFENNDGHHQTERADATSEYIVALHNHWPEVRSYIAKLEAAAGELTEQVTSEKHE